MPRHKPQGGGEQPREQGTAKADRHRVPRAKVSLDAEILDLLDQAARMQYSNVSQEIRIAVVKHLRDLGLIPPISPNKT
jgi:hypothetical protein